MTTIGDGKFLLSLVKIEAEEASSLFEGSNDSLASYEADLANEQANVYGADRDPCLCADNYQ